MSEEYGSPTSPRSDSSDKCRSNKHISHLHNFAQLLESSYRKHQALSCSWLHCGFGCLGSSKEGQTTLRRKVLENASARVSGSGNVVLSMRMHGLRKFATTKRWTQGNTCSSRTCQRMSKRVLHEALKCLCMPLHLACA